MPNRIVVTAACLFNEKNELLLVRKRGAERFMLPGGKPEAGESELEALERELSEELGISQQSSEYSFLGKYLAPAANEVGMTVEATVYRAQLSGPVTIAAEIEESLWFDIQAETNVLLAPLLTDHVFPDLWAKPV
jgi:8-oxo-dGTP pyrophosphatase MutT (NUDIX family)